MKIKKTVKLDVQTVHDEDDYVNSLTWEDFISGVEAMKRALPNPNDQPLAEPTVRASGAQLYLEWEEEVS